MQTNTDKKNQHYIPKFYLRNFSYHGNGNQIGIYNLKSSFYFRTAKLKTQGSKDFYYGRDGIIEDKFSIAENPLSCLIKEIIETQTLPQAQSIKHRELLAFIAITHLRNPVKIDLIKSSSDALEAHILQLSPTIDKDKLPQKMSHEEAIKISISNLKNTVDMLADLDYKLLINNTNIPFISSDFPIVKYNRFLELKKWPLGKTGYANIGLQIFIPLNSKISLVFFDSGVYKVGAKKWKTVYLNNKNDINKLNKLQVINCFETLYFNEEASDVYIRDLVEKAKRYKRANQPKNESTYLFFEGENKAIKEKDKDLLVLGMTDCETNLEVSCIRFNSRASKIKLTNSAAQLRPITKRVMESQTHNIQYPRSFQL